MIMTRNLLYTAITRAKRLAVIVGEPFTVKRMVQNNYIASRNSALKHFLKEAENDYDRLFGGL
jgi:exodeoxyribonuclease V alpha subunit